jgi:hypothetical protein
MFNLSHLETLTGYINVQAIKFCNWTKYLFSYIMSVTDDELFFVMKY